MLTALRVVYTIFIVLELLTAIHDDIPIGSGDWILIFLAFAWNAYVLSRR